MAVQVFCGKKGGEIRPKVQLRMTKIYDGLRDSGTEFFIEFCEGMGRKRVGEWQVHDL